MSGFQSKKAMSKDKLTPQPKTEKMVYYRIKCNSQMRLTSM